MSTASKREELEAMAWHAMRSHKTCTSTGSCPGCNGNVDDMLAAAADYASAFAEEKIARMTPEQWHARLRLAEATAEADRRTA